LPTARRQQWAARWQRDGGRHSCGSRHHHRAATARHRSDNEDTNGNSNGGGTDNNQHSTKSSNRNGNGNGDNDSNDGDDENEGNGSSRSAVAAPWRWRPAWRRQRQLGKSTVVVAAAARQGCRQRQRNGLTYVHMLSVLGTSMSGNRDTKVCPHTVNHVTKIGLSGQQLVTFRLVADMLPTCCQHFQPSQF
jgi:hypothetical protein